MCQTYYWLSAAVNKMQSFQVANDKCLRLVGFANVSALLSTKLIFAESFFCDMCMYYRCLCMCILIRIRDGAIMFTKATKLWE